MFAYCGNNPVKRADAYGELWEIVTAGIIASVVSGISNAISTAMNGGSVEECLVAGLIGAGSSAVGFIVAAFTGFVDAGNLLGRAVATSLCDLGTTYYLYDEITNEDVLYTTYDAITDVGFSTCAYSYTRPIKNFIKQSFVNSIYDGGFDMIQTYFLNYGPLEESYGFLGGMSKGLSFNSFSKGGVKKDYVKCAI